MLSVKFTDFSGGLDQRQKRSRTRGDKSVWNLVNCYPAKYGTIRKRGGFKKMGSYRSGLSTIGFQAFRNVLWSFWDGIGNTLTEEPIDDDVDGNPLMGHMILRQANSAKTTVANTKLDNASAAELNTIYWSGLVNGILCVSARHEHPTESIEREDEIFLIDTLLPVYEADVEQPNRYYSQIAGSVLTGCEYYSSTVGTDDEDDMWDTPHSEDSLTELRRLNSGNIGTDGAVRTIGRVAKAPFANIVFPGGPDTGEPGSGEIYETIRAVLSPRGTNKITHIKGFVFSNMFTEVTYDIDNIRESTEPWDDLTSRSGGQSGFINTDNNFSGDAGATTISRFDFNTLAVFGRSSLQVWSIADNDESPTSSTFDIVAKLIGLIEGPGIFPEHVNTIVERDSDILFLSNDTFRRVYRQEETNIFVDEDTGEKLGSLIKDNMFPTPVATQYVAVYLDELDQYWCINGDKAFVYTQAKLGDVLGWSIYTLPVEVDYAEVLNGELFLRSGDDVWKYVNDLNQDDGVNYEMKIETFFEDFKTPALKHVVGADVVVDGACTLEFTADIETEATQLTFDVDKDTRLGGIIPVELVGEAFALTITSLVNEPLQFSALNYYYEELGFI